MPKKDTMRIRMTAQTSQALEEIETPTVNAAAALGYDAKRVRTVEGKNQVTSTWEFERKSKQSRRR